jgi:cytoskeleton protein RodZ
VPAPAPADAASAVAATPPAPAASAAPLPANPAPAPMATPMPAPTTAAASVPVAAPAAGGETVFAAPAPSAAPTAAPAVAGIVQLRSTEASWMDIRDARGTVLLKRTVLPGESVGLNGNLPIRLTIGNAAATQLEFRGRPVDLAARTRDNVARVELQ